MKQSVYRFLIELTNGRWTSLLLRKFAQSKWSRFLIPSFAKTYQINLEEMAQPLGEFSTLHEFFVRKLKDDARKMDGEPHSVISPVDAVVEDIGSISADSVLQIKGKGYSLEDMLGSKEKANGYVNGVYVLLYLSPSNYHRIHSPLSGRVIAQYTLGEKSYPVNQYGLKYGRDTLSKNYRKITEVEHSSGRTAIVKVGAMFVNSIETTYRGEMLEKGEEIAYFTFGSTVVLLFEQNSFVAKEDLVTPAPIKVGELLGHLPSKE